MGQRVLTSRVLEWFPDTEGAGEEGALPSALASHVRPAALADFEKALAAVFVAGAEVCVWIRIFSLPLLSVSV